MPEFYITAHSTKTISIRSGVYDYNAAAPGVLPAFGSKNFLTGGEYSWTFYITHIIGRANRRPVSPALIAESKRLQAEFDAAVAEVRFEKRQIDADRVALGLQRESWQRHSDEIDSRRQSLDLTDAAAVDEFNRLVDATNDELASLRVAEQRLNSEIDAYNSKIDALNTLRQRLRTVAEKINASQ
jgi:hypothetical protein